MPWTHTDQRDLTEEQSIVVVRFQQLNQTSYVPAPASKQHNDMHFQMTQTHVNWITFFVRQVVCHHS